MAGVRLGQSAPRSEDSTRILAAPMSGWGPMTGFCFEGSNCPWDVPGGGGVAVLRNVRTGKVTRVFTTAPGWRTRRGGRPGLGVAGLLRRYGSRVRAVHTSCLNGFGGQNVGYGMERRGGRGFTLFETNRRRTRVRGVWIGAGRLPPYVPGC